MSKYIPFRLRPVKDDDIDKGIDHELERAAKEQLELDRSDIIRAALRFYFKYKNALPSSAANGTVVTPAPAISETNLNPAREIEQQAELQRTSSRVPGQMLLNNKKIPANTAGTSWKRSGR